MQTGYTVQFAKPLYGVVKALLGMQPNPIFLSLSAIVLSLSVKYDIVEFDRL